MSAYAALSATLLTIAASERRRMNTNISVEVYLGNPITVASEARFPARLRRDLVKFGVSARILANLHLGADDRQVDFVGVTGAHVLQGRPRVHRPRGPSLPSCTEGRTPWQCRGAWWRKSPLPQGLTADGIIRTSHLT